MLFNGQTVILAPMAGITDLAFRAICREFGADMTYTEMVSAKALNYNDKKTGALLKLNYDEHPCAAQIFGSEPNSIVDAALKAAEMSGADYIDINMGCPVGKIVSNGDGCALMRSPENVRRILDTLVDKCPVPITIKIRKGWDNGSINFIDIAQIAEKCGVAAVCLHARTKTQMYSGKADWDSIRELKAAVSIPVIANGDIFSADDAERILKYTKADAIMIGRGAFGNPWLFNEIKARLNGLVQPKPPDVTERCETAVRQFEMARGQKGEHIACLEARKHYAWYLHGIPYAGYYREQIMKITCFDDIYKVTKNICRDL